MDIFVVVDKQGLFSIGPPQYINHGLLAVKGHPNMSSFTIPENYFAHLAELSKSLPPLTAHDASDPIFQLPKPNPPTQLTSVVVMVQDYIKGHIPDFAINHSYRCWLWGRLVAARFGWDNEEHGWNPELFLLIALLHDIGCSKECIDNPECQLNFEIWGGIHARELLLQAGVGQALADEVCESIVRHTEEYTTGTARLHVALMQLAPLQDFRALLTPLYIHPDDLRTVCAIYPRLKAEVGFNERFGSEIANKPGCWSIRWGTVMLAAIGLDGVDAYKGIP